MSPRKSPVQARSAATVEALREATIQVLLDGGIDRLTTTRVAERAGTSVGTLYQYYPNKQALLRVVLEAHLSQVSDAVAAACDSTRGRSTTVVLKHAVEAFVDAKMVRADISTALYLIAADVDGPNVARQAMQRSAKVLERALKAAPDSALSSEQFAIQMLFGAMAGSTKAVLDAGASPAMVKSLRHHLVLLGQSYLTAAAATVRT